MNKPLNTWQQVLYRAGALMLLVGAAAFVGGSAWAMWLYTVGSLAYAAMQWLQRYRGHEATLRRLQAQQLLGACFLLLAALFMAMQVYGFGLPHGNGWMVFMAIGCVFQLYTAFRLPAEMGRRHKGQG